jgi:F-type H+-transporting ATPase subunit b
MLDFSNWFFVLLVNFLVLLWVMNRILFRPILKVFDEREQAVDGALEEARKMQEQKDELLEEIRQAYAEARSEAKTQFEAVRQEGLAAQREAMEAAGQEAARIMEEARTKIKGEAEKARASLRGDVEKFSEEIVRKLVGV